MGHFFNPKHRLHEVVVHLEAALLSIQVQINQVPVQLVVHTVAAHAVVGGSGALLLRVGVLLVNERLEVHDFNVAPVAVGRRDHRVHLGRVHLVASQQFLDRLVVKQVLLCQAQNLKSLLLRNEAPFYSQALVCHSFAALILNLLLFYFVEVPFFLQEALYPK